jgi:hypothetical protein
MSMRPPKALAVRWVVTESVGLPNWLVADADADAECQEKSSWRPSHPQTRTGGALFADQAFLTQLVRKSPPPPE